MKTRSGDGFLRVSSTSWLLSVLVLLCGCGGGGMTSTPTAQPVLVPPSGLPAQGLNIAGNWHFSTTSTASGTPAVSIDGSINQSGSSLRGAVHVDGSNCFDRLTTVGLTGTLNGSNVSLTSTSGHDFHRQHHQRHPHRDVYHQRWLCQRRPGKRRGHQDTSHP